MRYLFILLLTTTIIFAKSKDSCYSIQLKSFVLKENSTYSFDEQKYPESCQLISFTNINAIRCGCINRYSDAKIELKALLKFYPNSMIVTTYKYRFKTKKPTKRPKPKIEPILIKHKQITPKTIIKKETLIPAEIKEEKKIIKEIVIIEGDENLNEKKDDSSFRDDIAVQGHIDLIAQYYLIKPKEKHPINLTASAVLEMAYNKDNLKAKAKLKAQQDYYDFQGSSDKTKRSFVRLDEFYLSYDFEDDQIMFGKNIRFWGALEVRNITDAFNRDELRAD